LISRETLPRPSPSSNRIAVLGGGSGLGSVLRALRDHRGDLTVIVAMTEDAGATGRRRSRVTGSALTDLRLSLEALTNDEVALARAIKRPLQIDRLGRHPLGNLVIQSMAAAFDDLGKASAWLGAQLGIAGSVLPVTSELVRPVMDADDVSAGVSVSGSGQPTRLRFVPERPRVSPAVLHAIERARFVLLAPGSLWRSVLATSAIPDVALALHRTRARVIWICNLEPQAGETANDHLDALRRHRVRVDAVIYDPSARLHFSLDWLAGQGVEALPSRLRGSKPGIHDRDLLGQALTELVGSADTGAANAVRRD
jgi:uncharacterized cofD-like protein